MKPIAIKLTLLIILSLPLSCQENNIGETTKILADDTTTLKQWLRLAEQGNADAQNRLGAIYYYGYDVDEDYKKAEKWWKLAAEQGQANSLYELGRLYRNGEKGVLKDSVSAERLLISAAGKGYVHAQRDLCRSYSSRNNFVPINLKAAIEWCRLAANQGDASAQVQLGDMYKDGYGVAKDNVKAYSWYSISVMNGYEFAARFVSKLSSQMNHSEIYKAQELARKCVGSDYKKCD